MSNTQLGLSGRRSPSSKQDDNLVGMMDVSPSYRPHKLLGAEDGAVLGGGRHPFYNEVANEVAPWEYTALHKLLNTKQTAGVEEELRVVEDASGKHAVLAPKLNRWGKPQMIMEHAHVLSDAKAFVSDGEYIIPVLSPAKLDAEGKQLKPAQWAVVHIFWEQFAPGTVEFGRKHSGEVIWNKYPVWQMRADQYVNLGPVSSVDGDEAGEAAFVWAQQLKDTRLLEEQDGHGHINGSWQEMAMSDETLEAIDYHQRFGHRMVSHSSEDAY